MARNEEELENEIEERLVNEEYRIWKNNTPFLYDFVMTHALEWPSLTVQWLPDRDEPNGKDYSVQKLIVGTHTADNEPNYLLIAEVKLPLEDESDDSDYDRDDDALRSDPEDLFCSASNKIQIVQEISHDGEVNRARYMPQLPSVIATKAVNAEVYVFDYTKHPSKPPVHGECKPDLRLRGHGAEGYGLSWNKFKPGLLLSGSDDALLCLWDINATPNNKALDAMQVFEGHDGCIEDVAWHLRYENLFGSVGDDKYLHLWDLRSSTITKPIQSAIVHRSEVNCLAFNPVNEWVLATGSTDKTIKLFDRRNLSNCVHTFDGIRDEVFQIEWNPERETILASCSLGRRVLVWDTSRVGLPQTEEDAADAPPECLFIHGGHTSKVSDFSWNPCEDMVIASVASDNLLHIWQMHEGIYNNNYEYEDEDDEDDDLFDLPPPTPRYVVSKVKREVKSEVTTEVKSEVKIEVESEVKSEVKIELIPKKEETNP